MTRYKRIRGFQGYWVGTDGSVWSYKQKKPRRLSPNVVSSSGHLVAVLSHKGTTTRRLVHHLVLEAFVGPCPEGMECRHFPDRNPANNNLTNLQWGTKSQNMLDKTVHGTQCTGEKHGMAKLTDKRVLLIRKQLKSGRTQNSIANEHGVARATIRRVRDGVCWSHI